MNTGTRTAASGGLLQPLNLEHQQAIENALSMALHHVRSNAPGMLHRATAKANRALTLLKRASAAANDSGRPDVANRLDGATAAEGATS